MMRRIALGTAAAAAAATLVFSASLTASALDASSDPIDKSRTIELLRSNNVPLNEAAGPSLNVTIPSSAADSLLVDSDAGEVAISLPTSEKVNAVDLASTASSYRLADGTVLAVVENEGGAQIVSLIPDASASEEFSYELAGDFDRAELTGYGTVLLWKADGSLLGGFFPAWAKDAKGKDVPTRYRLDGSKLVQVVDHQGVDGLAYPITADPRYGSGVLSKSTTSIYSGGGYQISAWLSAWGRAVYLTDSRILAVEGWGVLKKNHWQIRDSRWKTSLAQQWDCHIAGGWIEWGSWDLETKRPANSKWRDRMLFPFPPASVCNW